MDLQTPLIDINCIIINHIIKKIKSVAYNSQGSLPQFIYQHKNRESADLF